MSIKVIANMYCAIDAENAFVKELRKLISNSSTEEGCLKYELYRHKAERGKYVIVEEWGNEDTHNKHKQSRHYKYFRHILPAFLTRPAEIQVI